MGRDASIIELCKRCLDKNLVYHVERAFKLCCCLLLGHRNSVYYVKVVSRAPPRNPPLESAGLAKVLVLQIQHDVPSSFPAQPHVCSLPGDHAHLCSRNVQALSSGTQGDLRRTRKTLRLRETYPLRPEPELHLRATGQGLRKNWSPQGQRCFLRPQTFI